MVTFFKTLSLRICLRCFMISSPRLPVVSTGWPSRPRPRDTDSCSFTVQEHPAVIILTCSWPALGFSSHVPTSEFGMICSILNKKILFFGLWVILFLITFYLFKWGELVWARNLLDRIKLFGGSWPHVFSSVISVKVSLIGSMSYENGLRILVCKVSLYWLQ